MELVKTKTDVCSLQTKISSLEIEKTGGFFCIINPEVVFLFKKKNSILCWGNDFNKTQMK